MKQLKFNSRSGNGNLIERTGYCFTYPDLPEYKFALYRAHCSFNSNKRWVVIELSTGLGIGGNSWTGGQTRKIAIQEAKEILDRVGKEALKQRVTEVIDSHSTMTSGRAN